MKAILLLTTVLLLSVTAPAQIPPPYFQDFEGSTFPPSGWQTFPIGSPINWQRDTTASGYGASTACASFDNFNNAAGTYFGIRLPSMNFAGVTQPYIRFDVAYAVRTGTASDVFGIWWSNNGTSNWQNIINYSGITLVTASGTTSLFVPTANEWETKTLSLASLAGLSFVRLAIEDDCNHGNKIYVDNIHVFDSAAVGIKEIYSSSSLSAWPSLFHDFINIHSAQPIRQVELFNVTGALVSFTKGESADLKIEGLSGLPSGVYFLKVLRGDGVEEYRKVVKQ